jgi:serine/threonine-protein kinase
MVWAAEKATTLAPNSSEAQLAFGVSCWYQWDWDGAEEAFRRSLFLNPNNFDALHWQAVLLSSVGRADEAIELVERASGLEPQDPHLQVRLAWPFNALGLWDEAIEHLQGVLEEWPENDLAYWNLAVAYSGKGDLERALSAVEEAIALMEADDLGDEYSVRGYLFGRLGQAADARTQLENLDRLEASGRYVSPVARSMVHLGMGEVEEALNLLEDGYRTQAGWMQFAMTAPFWKDLHTHPRFVQIRRSLGLGFDPFDEQGVTILPLEPGREG